MSPPIPRPEPFPLEELRDLIGVVRAVFLAARARRAGRVELARIERIGRELCDAYDLARSGDEVAAWAKAEHALVEGGALVSITDPAEEIVWAARERVRRAGGR